MNISPIPIGYADHSNSFLGDPEIESKIRSTCIWLMTKESRFSFLSDEGGCLLGLVIMKGALSLLDQSEGILRVQGVDKYLIPTLRYDKANWYNNGL